MMKKFWSLALLAISVLLLNGGFRPADSPPPAKEEINWISVEEAAALSAQDGKKLIIDLYTDWCGWCKRMDRDTYAKAEVIRYINEHYHAVKFNAEQKESVTVGGITYNYLPDAGRRGVHELAAKMLNGKLSYPSTVFFQPDLSIITIVPGYQNPEGLMPILSYIAEDAFQTTGWPEYQQAYGERSKETGK